MPANFFFIPPPSIQLSFYTVLKTEMAELPAFLCFQGERFQAVKSFMSIYKMENSEQGRVNMA